jgi:hypothetical protein
MSDEIERFVIAVAEACRTFIITIGVIAFATGVIWAGVYLEGAF